MSAPPSGSCSGRAPRLACSQATPSLSSKIASCASASPETAWRVRDCHCRRGGWSFFVEEALRREARERSELDRDRCDLRHTSPSLGGFHIVSHKWVGAWRSDRLRAPMNAVSTVARTSHRPGRGDPPAVGATDLGCTRSANFGRTVVLRLRPRARQCPWGDRHGWTPTGGCLGRRPHSEHAGRVSIRLHRRLFDRKAGDQP